MAKLYFYYAAMNSGKSTVLLQCAYNYQERHMNVLLFIPTIDNRYGNSVIHSRIGLTHEATSFDAMFDFYEFVLQERNKIEQVACVLVDEAQFLTKDQVMQLTNIVDELNIPVMTFGLRTDFRGEAFEGSLYLLTWADQLSEIKSICFCGKKAIMSARINPDGTRVLAGNQILIGGNDQYLAFCRKHFKNK